jgi:hypothetical protein
VTTTQWATEYREQKRADKLVDAGIRRDNAQFAAEQRRKAREYERELKARDKADRKAERKAFLTRLPDVGMSALWASVIVLPLALAWTKQAEFAHEFLHLSEPFHHLFPASIEVSAWVCAFEAHRRGAAGRVFVRWMWILAGVAASINATHGGTWQASVSLAVLSVLGVRLHSLRTGLEAGRQPGRAVRALWRRVRYPRLSLAAASIRAARDLDVATAWRLAWEDRYGVGPDSTCRDRTLGRLIITQELQNDRKAARAGELTILGGKVSRGFAPSVREMIDRERAAMIEHTEAREQAAAAVVREAQDVLMAAGMVFGTDALTGGFGTPESGSEQREQLSPRATELLPALREAIKNGEVRPAPGVRAIRQWCTTNLREPLGVPVASELRDAVAGLHLVDVGQADDTGPSEPGRVA